MVKKLLKRTLGPALISRIRYCHHRLKYHAVVLRNKVLGYSFMNIGAGRNVEMPGWWTGDYQAGFVIDKNTKLPFKDNSIEFAYSSLFIME